MNRYAYIVIAAALCACIVAMVGIAQVRASHAQGKRRTWVSYLLVWPLVLGADKSKRAGRLFTKREWVGWAVVGLLILGGILVSSHGA